VFTTGNSSQISDGVAALVLASREGVERYKLQKPLARVIGGRGQVQRAWRFLKYCDEEALDKSSK